MEKFRSSSDAAVGIHPFLPDYSKNIANSRISVNMPPSVTTTSSFVTRAIYLIQRFPFAIVFLMLWLVVDGIFSNVVKIRFLCRLFRDEICSRILLSLIGCGHVASTESNLEYIVNAGSRRKVRQDDQSAEQEIESISDLKSKTSRSPCIIVTNAPTVPSVLWLALTFTPDFYIPAMQAENQGGALVRVGAAQALFLCAKPVDSWPSWAPSSPACSIQKAVANSCGQIVIFAEGMPTNSKGVVRFPRSLGKESFDVSVGSDKCELFVVGFQYDWARSATLGVGNWFSYLIRLVSFPKHEILWGAMKIQPISSNKAEAAKSSACDHVRHQLARSIKAPELDGIDLDKRILFEKQWLEHQKQ